MVLRYRCSLFYAAKKGCRRDCTNSHSPISRTSSMENPEIFYQLLIGELLLVADANPTPVDILEYEFVVTVVLDVQRPHDFDAGLR